MRLAHWVGKEAFQRDALLIRKHYGKSSEGTILSYDITEPLSPSAISGKTEAH
ncbi:hypothetical protein thsrh120_26070 [Rhizobium sp. No.120]